MSIFIGKDNLNNPIVHITDEVNTKETMKAGVNNTTTFHSDLPYMESLHVFTVPVYRNVTATGGGFSDYSFTALFPDWAIDLVNLGYLFSIAVATTNSNSVNTLVDTASRFFKRIGATPAFDFNINSPYPWGPTENAGAWESAPSSYPSYTNNYLLLSNLYNYEDKFLYPHNYGPLGNALDNVIGNIATVIIYNIQNGTLVTPNEVSGITINKTTFALNTANGSLRLEDLRPIRLADSATSTTVSPKGTTVNFLPYYDNPKVLSSWEINCGDSGNSFIRKYFTDGSSEIVAGNTAKNLVLVDMYTASYDLRVNNGTATQSLVGPTVASDEYITVISNGTFINSVAIKTTGGFSNMISESAGYVLAAYGRTHRHTNGVVYGNLSYLSFGVASGTLVAQVKNVKQYSTDSDASRFYGTATILKFKLK